jgi:hypothetical protein
VLRVETQQTQLAAQQTQLADQQARTHLDVGKVAVAIVSVSFLQQNVYADVYILCSMRWLPSCLVFCSIPVFALFFPVPDGALGGLARLLRVGACPA